jgi:predicted nucleotidyltransferase
MNIELFQPKSSSNLESAILSILDGRQDMRMAILFGSLSSGKARMDSDLDFALDVGHQLDAIEKMQLIGDLSAAIGRPIDLVDPANRYLGTLARQEMPRAFGPGGRLAYLEKDDLDVQHVVVKQLLR